MNSVLEGLGYWVFILSMLLRICVNFVKYLENRKILNSGTAIFFALLVINLNTSKRFFSYIRVGN